MRWPGRDRSRARALRVAAEVEDELTRAFGRDRVNATATGGATTIRRSPVGAEPLMLAVVNPRGDVSVLLDNFESVDDWRTVIATVASPRILDVHWADPGVHCFVLDGNGGPALFTELGEQAISDTDTESWLRSLEGWPADT